MSNATQHSRNSGEGRRRRSRGGRNQNKQQSNRRSGDRGAREGRSDEFRPQGSRPYRDRKPVKLTWWQKLLKLVGLYKKPARPARGKDETKTSEKMPKSNVRNVRSAAGEAKPAAETARRSSRGGDPSTVESSRVYVGNLSYDVTEQDLQELFKGIGGVRNVEIVYNRTTHRSKGYGFVEMLHKDEAVRAVEVLNDQPFMGRNLVVSGANSKGKDEREDQEDAGGESRIVSLAPLSAEPADPQAAETEIQTIVEENPSGSADGTEDTDDESGRRSEVA